MEGPPSKYARRDAGPGLALQANLFTFRPVGGEIYKHHVDFEPADCGPRTKMAALHGVPGVGDSDLVLSGHTLLLRTALPATVHEFVTQKQSRRIVVRVQAGIRVDLTRPDNLREALTLNNLVIRRSLLLMPGLVQLGRKFVLMGPDARPIDFPREGVRLFQSAALASVMRAAGALAELDIATRVLSSTTLHDILRNRRADPRELQGMRVMTTYNNMVYRIKGVSATLTAADTFERKSGERISFVDYARQMYAGVRITDDRQPMVEAIIRGRRQPDGTREERVVHLIPELCTLVGMTARQMASTNLRRDMISKTKLDPATRMRQLAEFVDKFNSIVPGTCLRGHALQPFPTNRRISVPAACPGCGRQPPPGNTFAYWCKKCKAGFCPECPSKRVDRSGFRIAIDNKPIHIQGRQLPEEVLEHLDTSGRKTQSPVKGQWDDLMRRCSYGRHRMERILFVFRESFSRESQGVFDHLSAIGKGQPPRYSGLGIELTVPKLISVPSRADTPRAWCDVIRAELGKLPGPPDICLVFVPSNDKEAYDELKRLFHEHGVVTQFFTEAKARGHDDSIFTKVLVQMMAKLGMAPWRCSFNNLPPETMFAGIDAVRSGRGTTVTMVASTDTTLARFCSQASRTQEGGVASLTEMFGSAFSSFRERTGKLPRCIVIFRNGVSDAEIRRIEKPDIGELAQIDRAIESAWGGGGSGGELPKVIFVLVIRKGTTRVFSIANNPPPGTVVDGSIVAHALDPELGDPRKDFFLISQRLRRDEGSVRPTHYRVLRNTSPLQLPDIEVITYKLCHLFFTWSGTVAVPSPVMLSQKLTRMLDEHRQEPPSGPLVQSTYYI